ncbi:MAG TPA: argininosuccinate synthase [Aquabacterium sp.]|uniref:argininosuccinate synthase n=1 Tax=Aquabacterium sp. TaxID=1872578 RepID=UPI002E336EFC|nr:argininosuccinate synthase [Aquabacterium sp.]HEX5373330.1 argininosuccinate synthase [Aquabacterium sp.]
MSKTAKTHKPAKASKTAAVATPVAKPVAAASQKVKKVVLAYSGGLDTSIILKWLQDEYNCEVVTFTADIGQGEEIEPARAKALKMGIKPENIFIEDLREEFVRDFVFPMFRANALYEGEYLLGTSIARPLIAKRLIEIAKKTRGDAISHGATGKGNDQVRFELGAYALLPGVKVIAPWREWDLLSREKLLAYADKHGIPVDFKKRKGGAPYSMDANLLHISYEGGVLEDPNFEPEANMWRLTVSPEKAPNKPQIIELTYAKGDVVAIDGVKMSPAQVLTKLNEIGGKHGIGRLDKVENRYVGMKSRGCYETPGGTILLSGHRAIESITLDREVLALKDDLMPRYARMIYNGYWFSPERELLQGLIDKSQETVNGTVKLKLYKGTILVVGRESKTDSLFDAKISTFDDDGGAYNQADAAGFIKLNALRLRIGANVKAARAAASKAKPAAGKKPAAKPAAKKAVAVKPAAKKAAAKSAK